MSAKQPLRVAHLVKCLGLGGTERQLVVLLRELDRTQVTPSLACMIKVGEYLPDVRALGLDPPEFRLEGSLLRPNTLLLVLRTAAWIRREKASLLHCHDFYSNVVGGLAARLVGVPWIVSRRDLGAWRTPAQSKVLAAMSRAAPMVLCNTQAARDVAVNEEGVLPERVRVVPNGLDVEAFDREARRSPMPALDHVGPVVTLVANMKHDLKGHDDFLNAALLVRKADENVRFLLIGDGELRPALEEQARQMGLGQSVFFAGARIDVPALLARSTIAVSASKSEGLSNAVMEAMAASLPVVATNVGGTPELVVHERSGFLVAPDDHQALASRLLQLLRSPATAQQFGLAGRRRIENEFSATRLAHRVSDLYAEVLQDKKAQRAVRGESDGRLSA